MRTSHPSDSMCMNGNTLFQEVDHFVLVLLLNLSHAFYLKENFFPIAKLKAIKLF